MGHFPIAKWGNHPIDSVPGTWYPKVGSLARPGFGDYRVVPWHGLSVPGETPAKVRPMEGQSSVSLIIVLFVLRLGVPVLITVAIAYGLRRLDAKWQAEAEAQTQAQARAITPQVPQSQPTRSGNGAGITIPSRKPVSPLMVASAGQPCWVVKSCSESMRATCAAFNQPTVPCWTARTQAEGRLPAGCKECKLYQPTTPLWVEQNAVVH